VPLLTPNFFVLAHGVGALETNWIDREFRYGFFDQAVISGLIDMPVDFPLKKVAIHEAQHFRFIMSGPMQAIFKVNDSK